MKIESPAFKLTDFENFLGEQVAHERNDLADRLERASSRLAKLGPRISARGGGEDSWNAIEVLAHIAGFSKLYGILVHKVAAGQLTELDLLSSTNIRDDSIKQMSAMEPADLLKMSLEAHARTASELRSLEVAALQRSATVAGASFSPVTAEFLARYPLVNHLEEHVEQLERMLA
ncbi:MAG: hypothetical protein NVS1B3_10780 [Candidatus Dormibacteraceae bacterium]